MQLVSLDFNPKTVDISSNELQYLTVTVNVTSDGAPITDIGVDFIPPEGIGNLYAVLGSEDLISGDANDGVYQMDFGIPRTSRLGTWTMDFALLNDQAGNQEIFGYLPAGRTRVSHFRRIRQQILLSLLRTRSQSSECKCP